MKKIFFILALLVGFTSCNYLDIVPDDKATIDDAFKNQLEAHKFLYTLYSYIPLHSNFRRNIDWAPTDEFTTSPNWDSYWFPFRDMRNGFNNASYPTFNFWSHYNSRINYSLYDGIRQAFLFLSRIDNVPGIELENARKWKAEARFLIGYYHYLLLRYYGPIVIVDRLIPFDAPEEELFAYRSTYDECVDFLVKWLDDVAEDLPLTLNSGDYGKPTKLVAKSLKARVLLYAASPLFNGNSDFYSNFKDDRGINLISQEYDKEKWKKAMDAAQEAITLAVSQNYHLYKYEKSKKELSLFDQAVANARYTMVDKWNSELIWGYTGWNEDMNHEDAYQCLAAPRLKDGGIPYEGVAPSLAIVETFYTDKGLPIDADPDFKYSERYQVGKDHETANLNFNREPRYYAFIGYDRGPFEISGDTIQLMMRYREAHGKPANSTNYSYTGFLVKKGVHPESLFESKSKQVLIRYPFPLIRFSELYLNYIEAYIEYYGKLDGQALNYLNELREKNGLPKWQNVKNLATREITPEELIRTERMIELSFEGHRFHDLRRWKLGEKYLNTPIYGCDVNATTADKFWQIKSTGEEQRVFRTPQDYLLPIHSEDLKINYNLVQNFGW